MLYIINTQPIKLRRQATAFAQVNKGGEGGAVAFLAGNDSAADTAARSGLSSLREKLRGEKNAVIIFGFEVRGSDVAALVKFGSTLPGSKFICLGDYANSRGAADMGVYPDLLPGYAPLAAGQRFADEWEAEFPDNPGMNLSPMLAAATSGGLRALDGVGSSPVAPYSCSELGPRDVFAW